MRPLHPPLPDTWTSRALRVAMSSEDWERFETLVRDLAPDAPTQARAHGQVISQLIENAASVRPTPGPVNWMDWERQKTLRLLRLAV